MKTIERVVRNWFNRRYRKNREPRRPPGAALHVNWESNLISDESNGEAVAREIAS